MNDHAFPRDQDFLIARVISPLPATFPRAIIGSFGFVTRITTRERLVPAVILIAARPEPPRNARERKPHAVAEGRREVVRASLDGGGLG